MASRSSARAVQRRRLRTFFCNRLKNDSMAALSAQAPTRPIEPTKPRSRSDRTKACERNWLPRSEWTTVPAPQGDGVGEGVDGELAGHPLTHRVADDPVRAGVLDRAEVELALSGR